MAYRIQYDQGSQKYEIRKQGIRWPAVIAGCVLLLLIFTWQFWPEGKAFIQELVFPGDVEATGQALEIMVVDLKSGAPLSDAVSAFCREVIYGAQSSD